MKNEKEKLIIDGNAFYEIDLECIKKQTENATETLSSENSACPHQVLQKRQRK